jgi:hypothetical protein
MSTVRFRTSWLARLLRGRRGVAGGGLAVVLIMAGWLVRRSLDRRRLCGWDAGWSANGPRWSPRR